MLSQEQVKQIKEQILKQIESFPPEQREAARKQIDEMSPEQLEAFLVKNKLVRQAGEQGQEIEEKGSLEEKALGQKCVFCLILDGKINAYKIDENKQALAILEINPVSKGHTIIIPKRHASIEKIPTQAFSLAKKISQKLKIKFKPEKIEISTASFLGHAVINVIPYYTGETGEKKKASEDELKELQEKLIRITKEKTIREKKPKKISIEKLPKAPVRFP